MLDYLLNTDRKPSFERVKQFGSQITKFNLRYQEKTHENIRLSADRIYMSGVFYRWYQKEKNGEPIPFDEPISTLAKVLDNRLKNWNLKAYNNWKKAFDLTLLSSKVLL